MTIGRSAAVIRSPVAQAAISASATSWSVMPCRLGRPQAVPRRRKHGNRDQRRGAAGHQIGQILLVAGNATRQQHRDEEQAGRRPSRGVRRSPSDHRARRRHRPGECVRGRARRPNRRQVALIRAGPGMMTGWLPRRSIGGRHAPTLLQDGADAVAIVLAPAGCRRLAGSISRMQDAGSRRSRRPRRDLFLGGGGGLGSAVRSCAPLRFLSQAGGVGAGGRHGLVGDLRLPSARRRRRSWPRVAAAPRCRSRLTLHAQIGAVPAQRRRGGALIAGAKSPRIASRRAASGFVARPACAAPSGRATRKSSRSWPAASATALAQVKAAGTPARHGRCDEDIGGRVGDRDNTASHRDCTALPSPVRKYRPFQASFCGAASPTSSG